jgi:hypothetical protein
MAEAKLLMRRRLGLSDASAGQHQARSGPQRTRWAPHAADRFERPRVWVCDTPYLHRFIPQGTSLGCPWATVHGRFLCRSPPVRVPAFIEDASGRVAAVRPRRYDPPKEEPDAAARYFPSRPARYSRHSICSSVCDSSVWTTKSPHSPLGAGSKVSMSSTGRRTTIMNELPGR